jgi:hypothetical protein
MAHNLKHQSIHEKESRMSDGYWQFEITLPISEAEIPKLEKLYHDLGQKNWEAEGSSPSAEKLADMSQHFEIGKMEPAEFTPQVYCSGFVFSAGHGWKKEGPHLYLSNADDGEWCDPADAASFLKSALIELGRDDVVEFDSRFVPFEEPDFDDMDEDEIEAIENGEMDEIYHYKVSKEGIEEVSSFAKDTLPTP